MATSVGTEDTIQELVANLLALEHDAIAAYDTALDKLEHPASKEQVFAACAADERAQKLVRARVGKALAQAMQMSGTATGRNRCGLTEALAG